MTVRVPRSNRYRTALAVLFAIFVLCSCTVTERQVAQQGGRIDELQERVLRLERALEEAQTPVAAPGVVDEQLARRLADLGQQVEEASAQLRDLRGRLDALERTSGDQEAGARAALVTGVETELAALAERLAALEAARTVPAPRPTSPPVPQPVAPPPSSAPAQAPALSGQELYDRAYALYKQGRYEDARELFQQYVSSHPATKLTDNALFWIGESHYDQARYEQAILEYDKVIQQFPEGDKVASALLKQAFAFDAIGDPVDAKILLRKLLREHPSSEQAGIARKKLEMLGE